MLDGRSTVADALGRYGAFSASHRLQFECMYAAQQSVQRLHGRPMDGLVGLFGRRRVSHWAFRHYLDIAPPSFALPAPSASVAARSAAVAA